MSTSSRREANKLIISDLKKEDAGVYKCTNAYAECFKFNLFLEEEREIVELYAELDATVEIACGEESTQYDSYIRWRRLNGVEFFFTF